MTCTAVTYGLAAVVCVGFAVGIGLLIWGCRIVDRDLKSEGQAGRWLD